MLSSTATYPSARKAMSLALAASLRHDFGQGSVFGRVTLAGRYVR